MILYFLYLYVERLLLNAEVAADIPRRRPHARAPHARNPFTGSLFRFIPIGNIRASAPRTMTDFFMFDYNDTDKDKCSKIPL